MKNLSCLALLILVSSCISYRHEYANQDGSKDVTRFGSFLMMGGASKIHTLTKQGTNYARTVSVGSVEGKGDVDMVEAISAGAARGAVEAMKKSGGVP